MKNKTEKKTKQKKEIKRPAYKKPRPKKYVEAKIPSLPPVPTIQLPITKEASDVSESSLPNDECLAELVNVANKKLPEPRPVCYRCGKDLVLLPLDGLTQKEVDEALFLLVRCSDLACDAGSATGLLGGKPSYLRRCGMLSANHISMSQLPKREMPAPKKTFLDKVRSLLFGKK